MSYIEMIDSSKFYKMGSTTIKANDKINFQIEKGEFCIIVGPSGAGKSTVLNILGGMDQNDKGKVFIDGKNISQLNEKQLTEYRRYDVGFVFQSYNLVQNLTTKENVELASQIVEDAMDAEDILEQVGLKNRMDNFPAQLSGGEQQRVSIARAIAKKPKLLLCDEPTGALDYKTGKKILKILQDMCKTTNTTVIVITHNKALQPMADRVIEISDGHVSKMYLNDHPESVENIEW